MPDNDSLPPIDPALLATAAQLRNNSIGAADVNPDQEGEYKHLAAFTGTPIDTVRNQPDDIKQKAAAQAFPADDIAQMHPNTASFLTDQNNMKLAMDDIGNMRDLESAVAPVSAIHGIGAPSVIGGLGTSFAMGSYRSAQGIRTMLDDALGFKDDAEAAKFDVNTANQLQAERTPKFDSTVGRWTYGGVSGLLNSIPALAAGAVTKNPYVAMAAFGAQAQTEGYADFRARGATPGMAAAGSAAEGAVMAGSSFLPLKYLSDKIGKVGAGEFLTGILARDIPTMEAQTLANSAIDTAVANPDKSWGDWLKDLPDQTGQAVTSALVFGGTFGAIHGAMGRMEAKAQGADNSAEFAAHLDATATASKLRERDPDNFKQFMQDAAKDGPVENLYIDPKSLAQAGIDPAKIGAILPDVGAQVPQAMETGNNIKIPVEDFATHLAGTELGQSLIDHIKTDPDGWSRAEKDEYMKTEGESLQAEMEQVLKEKQGDDAWNASKQVVHDNILDQLTTANRFTKDVNVPYATLHSTFHSVMAARQGITPEQMFEQHPVNITAHGIEGPQLEQGQPSLTPAIRVDGQLTKGKTHSDIIHDLPVEQARKAMLDDNSHVYVNERGKVLDRFKAQDYAKNFDLFKSDAPGWVKDGNELISDHLKPADQTLHQDGQEKPIFYSALQRGLEGLSQGKGSPEQWAGIIKNMTQKGIRQEEIEHTGVQDWLKDQKGRVTKEQVMDYLRANSLEVSEVMKGAPDSAATEEAINNFEVLEGEGDNDFSVMEGEDLVAEGLTEEEAHNYIETALSSIAQEKGTPTKFDKYVLPGGDNYRELLMTLPSDPAGFPEYLAAYRKKFEGRVTSITDADVKDFYDAGHKIPGLERRIYKSSHFDEGNVVAHLRFNDRTNSNGKKVLHIEEIQSDWHQAGRKNGYATPDIKEIKAKADKLWAQRSDIQDKIDEQNGTLKDLSGIEKDSDEYKKRVKHNNKILDSTRELTKQRDELDDERVALRDESQHSVPDAPFKTTWPELAFKRALRYAVENGYDKVTWTTGEQQAERYDLSKQVDSITAAKENGGFRIFARDDRGKNHDMGVFKSQDLEGVVGKDLAHKISAQDKDHDIYEGEDLKVGGEGMKGFYDKILPATVNKLVKKSGGKVEKTTVIPEAAGRISKGLSPEKKAEYLEGIKHYGTFEVHSLDITPALRDSVLQGQALFQGGEGQRGAFNPITNTITLLKAADLSTFLHESGHFFLETMNKMAGLEGAAPELKADMETTLKWLGVDSLADWNSRDLDAQREAHEQFARGFEAYLFEGKSPSLEMQGVFSRFRAWLVNVYRDLSKLNVQLSPEMRGVFDRMLATTDQIKTAEAARSFQPLFKTPEDARMTPEEYKAYHDLGVSATQEAISQMETRSLRDMKWASGARDGVIRKLQREAATKRKSIKAEVTDEVMNEPVNKARTFFKTGLLDGEATKGTHRIDVDAFSKMEHLPIDQLESKYGKYGILGKDGLDPDLAAEMFGYRNATELVEDLLLGEKPEDKIKGLTDQRMLERYGDLTDQQSIERAADEAIHNKVRAKFIENEVTALTKATGGKRILGEAAREYAAKMIARLKIGNVRPSEYTSAEAKAAQNSARAHAKDDLATAAIEKRNQLINNHAAREAYRAQDDVLKGLNYLKKFDRPKAREKIDVEYRDQIYALLERVDLRKSVSGADQRKESLNAFMERMSSQGYEPQIPDYFLNELNKVHYKQMSVEAFRGLVDSIKSIEKIGKDVNTIRVQGKRMALDLLATEAKDTMLKLPQRDPETNRGLSKIESKWLGAKQAGRNAVASILKMEQMFDWLDARNTNGVFNRAVFRRIADAGVKEHDMLAKTREGIAAMHGMEDVVKGAREKYTGVGSMIDKETGGFQQFTKKEMLMLAGNMGNESNTAKVMAGEGWKDADVWAFLHNNMKKADWDYVKTLAKAMEGLYPEKLAMSRRLGNTNPEKIAPRAFETPHGKYDGWYWPLVYDPARSQDVAERAAKKGDALFENNYTRANTDTGRMNTRNAAYARPLLLDLDAIPRVISDEIHDIAFREAILDADKFLSNGTVRKGIINALSQQHYDQLRPWLQSIANDGKLDDSGMRALKFFNQLAKGARTRATIVGLGFRLSTMLVHGGSAAMESIAELGPKWFGNGLRSFTNPGSWAENRDYVFERSGEMRNRMNEVDRDIRDRFREIDQHMLDPTTRKIVRAKDAMELHAYTGIAMLDMASALPTWMGAYNKAMTPEEKGGLNMSEQDAVYYADKTVRNAHGGQGVKDQAAVQRGPEFFKLFSMFYTFWNHNINRLMDTGRRAKELPATYASGDREKLIGDLSTVVMRTLIYTFGIQAMHSALHTPPPNQDNEGESWTKWAAKVLALSATSGIPIVRDVAATYLDGKDYSATPAAGAVKMIGASGADIWNGTFGDKPVSDKWVRHTLETAGFVFGLPLGQPAATAQFLWDVENNKQNPKDLADWWSGIAHGKTGH